MPMTFTLAAVHVSPMVAAPLGVVVGLALGWLWWWQGREDVPRSRRLIRRASLLLGLVLVPMLVSGLSFVDPSVDPRRYAQTWTLVLVVLALVVATAVIDALNSFRVHALEQRAEASRAADGLVQSVAQRKAERRAAWPGDSRPAQPTTPQRGAEEDRGPSAD